MLIGKTIRLNYINWQKGRIVLKEKLLSRINYIVVFFIPIILLTIHMIVSGCYPFGDKTILVGDANTQYISFMKLLIDKIHNGSSILFDWNVGMGSEMYQIFCYYLASPFNIIAVIIGSYNLELGVVITMMIQIGMCSFTMLYYLLHTTRNTMKKETKGNILCVLFSLCYGLCDYVLAYQYNYIWLMSLLMAPLVMLGVEMLEKNGDIRLYIISLTIVFITNFYFAWFICILSFVWFVDFLALDKKFIVKKIVRYLLCSVLSAMLSAFVLIPCYFSIVGRDYTTVSREDNYFKIFGSIGNFFQGFLWGSSVDTRGRVVFTNHNYMGLTILVLCILFFFQSHIQKMKRIKRAIIICIFAFMQNWAIGVYIFHGFTFPNLLFSRNMFVFVLLMIVTAFEAVVNLKEIRLRWCMVIGLAMIFIFTIALLGSSTKENAVCYIGSVFIIAALLICLVLYARNSIGKGVLLASLFFIGISELVSNAYIVESNIYEYSKDYKSGAQHWKCDYEKIQVEPGERKTAWMGSQNSMSYSDTNIYSSILCRDMLAWNRKLGLTYQWNGGSYAYKGTTPVTAMLSNVKYVLTDQPINFGGYNKQSGSTYYSNYFGKYVDYGIYDCDYMVGLGYMMPESIEKWNMESNPFEVQNILTNDILGVGNVYEKVDVGGISVSSNGCDILDYKEDSITYKNKNMDKSIYANLVYEFIVPQDMHMYICLQDDNQILCHVYLDSIIVNPESEYITQTEMLDLGEVKEGQVVTVVASNNSQYEKKGSTSIFIYQYYDAIMKKVVSSLRENIMSIDDISTTRIRGSIDVRKSGVLYTSIPYYRGSKVYVDGKATDLVKIGGAMCGVKLEEGTHLVEFKYFPYGLKAGLCVSLLGIIGFLLYLKRNNRENYS